MMLLAELLRLQGISPASTRIAEVLSSRQAGGLLGNSFTLPVFGRVLVQALRSCGEWIRDPAQIAGPAVQAAGQR
jgi:hypothetical protein